MKKSAILSVTLVSALAGLSLIPSCASLANLNTVRANQVGVPQKVYPATVTAAQNVTQDTGSTAKNIGTGVGAAVGLGAGQLMGKGSGRIASSVGFATAGALAGRYLVDAMGKTQCQRLTVKIDGSGESYSFVQPVYQSVGYIPVGTHGNYYHGSNAQFLPDGAGAAMSY